MPAFVEETGPEVAIEPLCDRRRDTGAS